MIALEKGVVMIDTGWVVLFSSLRSREREVALEKGVVMIDTGLVVCSLSLVFRCMHI